MAWSTDRLHGGPHAGKIEDFCIPQRESGYRKMLLANQREAADSYRVPNIVRYEECRSDCVLKEGRTTRILVERFQAGEDILERLNDMARRHHVTAGSVTALGAVEKAVVGFFTGNGEYSSVSLDGPLEVLSCVGNVSMKEGTPFVHAHMTLADSKGRAYGGHLMLGCRVGATFEVSLLKYDDIELARKLDPQTKLYLLNT